MKRAKISENNFEQMSRRHSAAGSPSSLYGVLALVRANVRLASSFSLSSLAPTCAS